MKKRLLVLSLFCALGITSLGTVTSCNSQPGGGDVISTPDKKELSITLEGDKVKGQILTISVKDLEGNAVENPEIVVLEGTNLVALSGNQLTLNEVGHVKLEVRKEGFHSNQVEFDIGDVVLMKLSVSFEGKMFHGETIKTIVKDEKGELLSDYKIDIRKGGDFAYSKGNDIILLDKGTVEGIISKDGYEDAPFSFVSQEVLRIKEIKDDVNQYDGKLVTVRGKVTASYGNTFYLMDGKHGFYVYNMNTLETTGDPGDGFVNGRVVMNEAVLVTAKVNNGKYGLQLAGNLDGSFISEACVLKSNMTVADPISYEVKNEADLASLNASPKLAGSRIKVTGKYITGDFSSAEQTGAKDAIFDFAYGSLKFQAKFNKYGYVSTVKSYWNREKIEAGDYVTLEGNFTNFQNTVSIDLADEGTTVHNESKDKNNIICSSSSPKVEIGKTITLSATLPEGMEGTPSFEITKGKDFATIEGNVLTGVKAGQVTLVAKVGDKQSMPIEIIVSESEYSKISSVRAMEVGAEVTVAGKVLAFYRTGLLIQDDSGFLFCKTEDDYYPHGINMGDTVKATGVRFTYQDTLRKIPSISNSQFEVIAKQEIETTYDKMNQSDFKTFTEEDLKNGKPVEAIMTVEALLKVKGTENFAGTGRFAMDPSDEPGTEYYFFGYDQNLYLKKYEKSLVKAIVYNTYETKIGKKGYVLMVTSAEKYVVNPESITLTLEKTTIDNHVTFGSAMTYADFEVGPMGATPDGIQLVVLEGADLVEVSLDVWHNFKIKAVGLAGTVKLQAQTADGSVKSNIVELTITQYVEE